MSAPNLTQQITDTLGPYGNWEERCQSGSHLMVDSHLCTPRDIMQVCKSLDCFGDNKDNQRPLPTAEIDAWQAAVKNCKQSQKRFRQEHPMIEAVWEMGQAGVADCQDGLARLSRGKDIKQDQEPVMFSTLTRYLPNAALQSEHAVRVSQEKPRSSMRQRFDQVMEPLGFSMNGRERQMLSMGDRTELESAMYRLQSLQSMDGDSYDHQALQSKLDAIHKECTANVTRLESTHKALRECIDEAIQFHYQQSEQQARQQRQQRKQTMQKQFEANLLSEIGSSQASSGSFQTR